MRTGTYIPRFESKIANSGEQPVYYTGPQIRKSPEKVREKSTKVLRESWRSPELVHGLWLDSSWTMWSPQNSMNSPRNSLYCPQNALDSPWNSKEFDGIFMEFCGLSTRFLGIPWNVHRIPWTSIEFPDIAQTFIMVYIRSSIEFLNKYSTLCLFIYLQKYKCSDTPLLILCLSFFIFIFILHSLFFLFFNHFKCVHKYHDM
jgi:hypothetical protein